jgi:hypothetical protein
MDPKRPEIDYFYELIMTFSNKKSLFSSKKIERFIVFWVFLIMTITYMTINMRTLEAWDFVEISALWLVYGGYNSLMSLRDKKIDKEFPGIEIDQPEATSGEEEEGDINPPSRKGRR